MPENKQKFVIFKEGDKYFYLKNPTAISNSWWEIMTVNELDMTKKAVAFLNDNDGKLTFNMYCELKGFTSEFVEAFDQWLQMTLCGRRGCEPGWLCWKAEEFELKLKEFEIQKSWYVYFSSNSDLLFDLCRFTRINPDYSAATEIPPVYRGTYDDCLEFIIRNKDKVDPIKHCWKAGATVDFPTQQKFDPSSIKINFNSIYEEKYVIIKWTDKIEGKELLVANSLRELVDMVDCRIPPIRKVIIGASGLILDSEGHEWNFAYNDPQYEIKKALHIDRKDIQVFEDGKWVDIRYGAIEQIIESKNYRIKPDNLEEVEPKEVSLREKIKQIGRIYPINSLLLSSILEEMLGIIEKNSKEVEAVKSNFIQLK